MFYFLLKMSPNWELLNEALNRKATQKSLLEKLISNKPLSVKLKIVRNLIDEIIDFSCDHKDPDISLACDQLIEKLNSWLEDHTED